MKSGARAPQTVAEYIKLFPAEVQRELKKLRAAIKEAAPLAEEDISYQMPAYKQDGPLVYFAAYKNHIGFYPTPTGVSAFKKALIKYAQSKAAVQFPHGEKLPLSLIQKIVKHRVRENLARRKKK